MNQEGVDPCPALVGRDRIELLKKYAEDASKTSFQYDEMPEMLQWNEREQIDTGLFEYDDRQEAAEHIVW